jgi:hypothetical protein
VSEVLAASINRVMTHQEDSYLHTRRRENLKYYYLYCMRFMKKNSYYRHILSISKKFSRQSFASCFLVRSTSSPRQLRMLLQLQTYNAKLYGKMIMNSLYWSTWKQVHLAYLIVLSLRYTSSQLCTFRYPNNTRNM